MFAATHDTLDTDQAILQSRMASLQHQYDMVNQLSAQMPLGIASQLPQPPPVPEVAPDDFWDGDEIRKTIRAVGEKSASLEIQFDKFVDEGQADVNASAVVRRAFYHSEGERALPLPSEEAVLTLLLFTVRGMRGNSKSTPPSGSAKRRPKLAEASRKQRQNNLIAATPMDYPTFQSRFDPLPAPPPPLPSSKHTQLKAEARAPHHTSSKRATPPLKRSSSTSSTASSHPSAPPSPSTTNDDKTRISLMKRPLPKPLPKASPDTKKRKKKKKKKHQVAFGATVRNSKNVITAATKKAQRVGARLGDNTGEIVKTVARAAQISAIAAEKELEASRRALEANEKEMKEVRRSESRTDSIRRYSSATLPFLILWSWQS